MLGLPVQTFAATSMLVCMGVQQAGPMQTSMADETMQGCHEREPSPLPSHECKHCTVCALASALPIPAADGAWSVAVSHAFPLLSAPTFGGHIPDGPERPPRSVLA